MGKPTQYDELISKFNDALDLIAEQAVEHLPQAAELALGAMQGYSIFLVVAGFVMSTLMGAVVYRFIGKGSRLWREGNAEGIMYYCIGVPIAFAIIPVSTNTWLNSTVVLTAYDPRLGLAIRALKSVGLL